MTDATAAAGAMPPGTYIEKRREAAGLEIVDVALMLAEGELGADVVADLLVKVEADDVLEIKPLELIQFLGKLQRAFGFDRDVYLALTGATSGMGTPIPPICRVCACTYKDPCLRADAGGDLVPCSWANAGTAEEPLCTACLEPTPANDRAAVPEIRDAA